MRKNVEFNSKGSKVRGVLVTPDAGKGPYPVAVMGGGWCYVKEIVLPHYAEAIVKAGVAVLMFDYRGLGESEGEPRQHIDPWGQVEDYKNAISFVMKQPEIDPKRIGHLGHLLCRRPRRHRRRHRPAREVHVSTVPVVEGWETMKRCHGERKFEKLLEPRAWRTACAAPTGSPSAMMPMSHTDPDNNLSSWPFPHVYEIFMRIKEKEAPRHEHRNTVESVELLLQYNVFPYAKRILNTPDAGGRRRAGQHHAVGSRDRDVQHDPGRQQGAGGAGEGEPHEPVLHQASTWKWHRAQHARFLKKHLIDEFTADGIDDSRPRVRRATAAALRMSALSTTHQRGS